MGNSKKFFRICSVCILFSSCLGICAFVFFPWIIGSPYNIIAILVIATSLPLQMSVNHYLRKTQDDDILPAYSLHSRRTIRSDASNEEDTASIHSLEIITSPTQTQTHIREPPQYEDALIRPPSYKSVSSAEISRPLRMTTRPFLI